MRTVRQLSRTLVGHSIFCFQFLNGIWGNSGSSEQKFGSSTKLKFNPYKSDVCFQAWFSTGMEMPGWRSDWEAPTSPLKKRNPEDNGKALLPY